jgi:hypothetical protein
VRERLRGGQRTADGRHRACRWLLRGAIRHARERLRMSEGTADGRHCACRWWLQGAITPFPSPMSLYSGTSSSQRSHRTISVLSATSAPRQGALVSSGRSKNKFTCLSCKVKKSFHCQVIQTQNHRLPSARRAPPRPNYSHNLKYAIPVGIYILELEKASNRP